MKSAKLATMEHNTLDTNQKPNLEVVEILHYCSDVDAAAEFYNGKLGWPVIWHFKGGMAGIDVGGVYLLTLIAAKFVEGWQEGTAVPTPRLSLKSQNLQADSALLEASGLPALDITGDPEQMLSADLSSVEGIELFLWQDTADAPATKVVDEYRAKRQPKAIYTLGECVFFVGNKPAAEAYFTTMLGFEVTERHGDAYCAMKLNGGPILGLYNVDDWWDKPENGTPSAKVRLFVESPDLKAEHLKQTVAGAKPGALKTNSGGLQWFGLTDPDGTAISFWQFKRQG